MKDFFEISLDDLLSISTNILTNGLDLKSLSFDNNPETIKLVTETLLETLYVNAQYSVFKRDIANAIAVNLVGYHSIDIQNFDKTASYIEAATKLEKIIVALKPVKIFAGPAASCYIRLFQSFKPLQNVRPAGIYSIGKLDNCRTFKAPAGVVPNEVIYVETNQNIHKFTLNGLKESN